MAQNSKLAAVLQWLPPIFNPIYKVLLLAVLIWIGVCLQDVATAIYSGNEPCVVDPNASDSGGESEQPGVIKPLLRGAL